MLRLGLYQALSIESLAKIIYSWKAIVLKNLMFFKFNWPGRKNDFIMVIRGAE
jgi:hypothetical protein